MGYCQRLMDQGDACDQAAIEINLRVGNLRRCEFDEDEVLDTLQNDFDAADALGTRLMRSAEPIMDPFDGDLDEMKAAIRRTVEDTPDSCRHEHDD